MGKLDGKSAIVTGASRGIGAEIARLFAKEGAQTVCAARTLREADGSDQERMIHLFRLAMARFPEEGERKRLLGFYNAQLKDFGSDVASASKVAGAAGDVAENYAQAAAWTSVARAVMNLDEFITRE